MSKRNMLVKISSKTIKSRIKTTKTIIMKIKIMLINIIMKRIEMRTVIYKTNIAKENMKIKVESIKVVNRINSSTNILWTSRKRMKCLVL